MNKHSTLNPMQQHVTHHRSLVPSSDDEVLPEWFLHETLDSLIIDPPERLMAKFMKRIRLILHTSEN
jgi:hypothetical protein